MMSSAGTSRASRSSKDKTVKVQHTQNTSNVKATGDGAKNQPTAEQMRLAQMIQDKNDISDDPVLQAKVKQVMELTGRSSDDAIVALHDCDEDPNRAVDMLLEGEDQQGEWQESGKRKKGKTQPTSSKGDALTNHTDSREKSRDRDDFNTRDSGPPRDRRVRQPPRLARKNREREENERNSQRNRGGGIGDDEGESRERSYERGRGRGRGRMNGVRHQDMDSSDSDAVYINHSGQVNGGGGRGRGRGGRSYRSSRYDKGPQIDTWTNETAENAEKENSTWEMSEDWTTDEWTGSLDETKVFTASNVPEPSTKGFSSTVGDNDAKMFTAPTMPVESQVFTSMTIENSSQSALNDTTNTLQNSIGQNSMGQNSHTLGQRLDLGLLLQKQPSETQPTTSQTQQSQFMSQFSKQATESLRNAMGVTSPSQQQSQFMTQFSKEATESIKSMMGIGTNSSSHQPTSVANQTVRPAIVSQSPPQQSQQQQQSQQVQQQLQQQQQQQQAALAQQRARPQRSKLPPPSKIPASAVEMPGHISSFQLDVQFGNWDSGFSFGSSRNDVAASYSSSSPATSTTTTSAQGNHLQESKATTDTTSSPISPSMTAAISSAASSKPIISSLDNMAQNQERSPRATVFQNATSPATTPNKDYSQSRLDQSRKQMTPPDPIPFPSDRKSSPHYTSQRSGHTSSSISNSKSATSPSMTFSQSSYSSSSYPSSGYQSSAKSPTGSYNSHQSNSLSSSDNLSSGLQTHMSTSPSQYNHQGHSGYQTSSSFQSQNAFSNQGQTSLYQSNSQPSSYSSQSPTTYQSQTSSSYQSQSGSSSYPSQSSTYHGRDNQSSSSSYQPSVSQSNSHYQSSGSQSSNTYQRDSQQSQGGYGSHQSYGSSSHQNSLPSSSMTISTSKLSDSLGKVSLKDSTLDSHTTSQNSYESSSTTTTPSISTATTTSASLGGGSASVSSALGLTSATTTTTSSSKSNLPVTSKAPPNLPPGVPLMGHNYMMQPGMPFAAFGLAQQPTMYSYEDLQLLQQRLPLPGYYDMPFQPPTTLTGREQGTLANVPYTGADGKLGRVDAQSPVQAQTSQQGQNQSGHQQTYMNPTIPPGYNYYYPGAAGMLPSGYSYTPPMFPVPSVTNAAHGGTTANAQFQKPGAYGSHAYNTAGAGYDDLNSQTQDYSKYGGASQSQSKGSAGGAVSSSATEIAGSTYGKTHTQSFDKASFHAATPPPFNLPMPTGTQAGPMAPTAAYGGPYVPVMPHQAHSQMLHPHLQQDSTGGSSRGSQQTSSQPKPGSNKPYGGYWSNN